MIGGVTAPDSDYAAVEMVPTRAPSLRRTLVTMAVPAVGAGIWATVEGTWEPLLVPLGIVAVSGPFPWQRSVFETRLGSALGMFIVTGVYWGVFESLYGRHNPVESGAAFGVGMAIIAGVSWKKERRKRSRRRFADLFH